MILTYPYIDDANLLHDYLVSSIQGFRRVYQDEHGIDHAHADSGHIDWLPSGPYTVHCSDALDPELVDLHVQNYMKNMRR